MSKIHFLAFTDSNMSAALNRIGNEAKDSRFFDSISLFTEKDFDSDYWSEYQYWYKTNKRGYGYWLWKPYFILEKLTKIDNDDFLCYCDAGCEINKNGRDKLLKYCELAKQSPNGIVCWETGHLTSCYSKGDIFDFFDTRNTNIHSNFQIMASILIIHKQKNSMNFIKDWYIISHQNPNLIDDSPSISRNFPDFIENRHDQSIFSMLCHTKGGVVTLPGRNIELWPVINRRVRRMKKEPFIVIRNKTGISRLAKYNKVQLTILNMLWDIENYISDLRYSIKTRG